MSQLASPGQLRAAFLRWALVLVPGVLLLGFTSGLVAGSSDDNPWFAALTKPATYPPPPTFPVVWTVLYVLMGVALAMVISSRGARLRAFAIVAFAIQLVLNLAWTPLFFGAHQISLALGLLVVLVVAVIATIAAFYRVRPVAAFLLVPYLAWIVFAVVLNWQFLQLNPQADGQASSGAAVRVEF